MTQELPSSNGGGGGGGDGDAPSRSPSTPAPAPAPVPASAAAGTIAPRRFVVGDKLKGPVADREANFFDGLKTVRLGDLPNVLRASCAPRSFMNGIIFGVGAGGASLMIVRTSISRACNLAVGSWLIGSIGSYEWCQWDRRKEKAKLKRSVEAYQAAKAIQIAEEKKKKKQQQQQQQQQQQETGDTDSAQSEPVGGGTAATKLDNEPKSLQRSRRRFW